MAGFNARAIARQQPEVCLPGMPEGNAGYVPVNAPQPRIGELTLLRAPAEGRRIFEINEGGVTAVDAALLTEVLNIPNSDLLRMLGDGKSVSSVSVAQVNTGNPQKIKLHLQLFFADNTESSVVVRLAAGEYSIEGKKSFGKTQLTHITKEMQLALLTHELAQTKGALRKSEESLSAELQTTQELRQQQQEMAVASRSEQQPTKDVLKIARDQLKQQKQQIADLKAAQKPAAVQQHVPQRDQNAGEIELRRARAEIARLNTGVDELMKKVHMPGQWPFEERVTPLVVSDCTSKAASIAATACVGVARLIPPGYHPRVLEAISEILSVPIGRLPRLTGRVVCALFAQETFKMFERESFSATGSSAVNMSPEKRHEFCKELSSIRLLSKLITHQSQDYKSLQLN